MPVWIDQVVSKAKKIAGNRKFLAITVSTDRLTNEPPDRPIDQPPEYQTQGPLYPHRIELVFDLEDKDNWDIPGALASGVELHNQRIDQGLPLSTGTQNSGWTEWDMAWANLWAD